MLTGLIVLLIVAGLLLYLVPMDAGIRSLIVKILVVAAVVIVALWVLRMFGVAIGPLDLP